MSFYATHLLFCTNERKPGKACCASRDASLMCDYAKDSLKKMGKSLGPGGVRVNKAGCLGRCKLGPILVIYPEGIWYTYKDEADIDEILSRHLLGGEIVTRLQLADDNIV